mmetsp:Transcript_5032/g.7474  ORF Transcript_5032/g.7474 Transcript_5032/m.7474 type:complete len:475 (+) Transcript_5032:59-1483(+)
MNSLVLRIYKLDARSPSRQAEKFLVEIDKKNLTEKQPDDDDDVVRFSFTRKDTLKGFVKAFNDHFRLPSRNMRFILNDRRVIPLISTFDALFNKDPDLIRNFRLYIADDPYIIDCDNVYLQRARSSERRQSPSSIIAYYEKAIERYPNDLSAYISFMDYCMTEDLFLKATQYGATFLKKVVNTKNHFRLKNKEKDIEQVTSTYYEAFYSLAVGCMTGDIENVDGIQETLLPHLTEIPDIEMDTTTKFENSKVASLGVALMRHLATLVHDKPLLFIKVVHSLNLATKIPLYCDFCQKTTIKLDRYEVPQLSSLAPDDMTSIYRYTACTSCSSMINTSIVTPVVSPCNGLQRTSLFFFLLLNNERDVIDDYIPHWDALRRQSIGVDIQEKPLLMWLDASVLPNHISTHVMQLEDQNNRSYVYIRLDTEVFVFCLPKVAPSRHVIEQELHDVLLSTNQTTPLVVDRLPTSLLACFNR